MFNIGDLIEILKYEGGAPVGAVVMIEDFDGDNDIVYTWKGTDGWLAGNSEEYVRRVS